MEGHQEQTERVLYLGKTPPDDPADERRSCGSEELHFEKRIAREPRRNEGDLQQVQQHRRSPPRSNTEVQSCRYATDVIGSCAFGANPRCFHNEDSEFRACAKRLFDWRSFERRFSFNAYFAAPVLAKVFGLKFWEPASSEYLKDFFWDSVKEREKSSFVRHDLIDILMKIKEDEVFMKGKRLE